MEEKNPAAVALGSLGGKAKTEKKAAASAENGKKGGRPRTPRLQEIAVTKDGKPRTLALRNGGGVQYEVVVIYPDGQSVRARYQPEPGSIPDLAYWAEKNGFEVVK